MCYSWRYCCPCFRYVFPCNRWLTAEKEVHLLPVAFKDLTRFGNIFFTETRKCLTDSQLWNSLLSQPTRNNFTRVQRVSCIFSLVMMSMLASAMFHQVANVATNSQGYTLGPVKFTLHEVYISIVADAFDNLWIQSANAIQTHVRRFFLFHFLGTALARLRLALGTQGLGLRAGKGLRD